MPRITLSPSKSQKCQCLQTQVSLLNPGTMLKSIPSSNGHATRCASCTAEGAGPRQLPQWQTPGRDSRTKGLGEGKVGPARYPQNYDVCKVFTRSYGFARFYPGLHGVCQVLEGLHQVLPHISSTCTKFLMDTARV